MEYSKRYYKQCLQESCGSWRVAIVNCPTLPARQEAIAEKSETILEAK